VVGLLHADEGHVAYALLLSDLTGRIVGVGGGISYPAGWWAMLSTGWNTSIQD
jgi:hypothetical protein